MEPESVFLSYVRYTFKRWAGFQQAITEGMGGEFANEKEIWLGNEMENYFKRYDKVYPDEVEDYLAEMIENEFNIIFEDDSVKEISHNFCNVYPLSLTNPDAEIFQDMRNKPIFNQQTATQPINQESSKPTHQEQNEQAACEKLEQLTVSENKEDDGWTVVKKKNKNK